MGGGSSSSTTSDSSSDSSSSGSHTLSVYAWDSGFNIPALEDAAADYKENVDPDFELNVIEQSGWDDVATALTTAASAGDYSTLPDIVLIQDKSFAQYQSNYPDEFIDMDDLDVNWDDFSSEKLDRSTVDGVHYGMPLDNSTVIAAYRTDLLGECGYTIDDLTGITWDRFIEIGKDVKETTGKYLMCMDGSGNDLVYMMLQAEGESQFKDGQPYITENEDLVTIVNYIVEMAQDGILSLANSWSDYTNDIQNDNVAGVMNGNWIIPTIELVEENSGLWEITTMPTLTGAEGYATSGGSSLYITANCSDVDLAKDFLAYTFGGSSETYDAALADGGVVACYTPAADSDAYNAGVEYFNDQPIYAEIVRWSANVPTIEHSDYESVCRDYIGSAIQNIINGADTMEALQEAEDQLNFEMGN